MENSKFFRQKRLALGGKSFLALKPGAKPAKIQKYGSHKTNQGPSGALILSGVGVCMVVLGPTLGGKQGLLLGL